MVITTSMPLLVLSLIYTGAIPSQPAAYERIASNVGAPVQDGTRDTRSDPDAIYASVGFPVESQRPSTTSTDGRNGDAAA
jgi:hypothetical protein